MLIWKNVGGRGKAECLYFLGRKPYPYLNKTLQETSSINITTSAIIDSMHKNEVPQEVQDLINAIAIFGQQTCLD